MPPWRHGVRLTLLLLGASAPAEPADPSGMLSLVVHAELEHFLKDPGNLAFPAQMPRAPYALAEEIGEGKEKVQPSMLPEGRFDLRPLAALRTAARAEGRPFLRFFQVDIRGRTATVEFGAEPARPLPPDRGFSKTPRIQCCCVGTDEFFQIARGVWRFKGRMDWRCY